jgi:GAF domain-containing protein
MAGEGGRLTNVDNREIWLAETLVELADTSVVGVDDTAYLAKVTTRLAELLGRAEIGLIIAEPTADARVAAATSERTRAVLSFELAHGEGPCVASYLSGQRILNQDIDTGDERWPRFATKARSAGFRSASALPMRRHDDTIGAVGILDTDGQPFSATEISLAQTLAETATISLRHQRALRQSTRTAEQLQQALNSRVIIEQAKGMTAARLGISLNEAFELLRGHARRNNMKLSAVANDTVHQRLTLLSPSENAGRGGSTR